MTTCLPAGTQTFFFFFLIQQRNQQYVSNASLDTASTQQSNACNGNVSHTGWTCSKQDRSARHSLQVAVSQRRNSSGLAKGGTPRKAGHSAKEQHEA
jgi:hypothetical protein